MALSTNGDHPMPKLSDTQLVILSAAAQRADLSVLPLPDSINLKGGALSKVMDSLRRRGLIRVIGADGGPERVALTSEGKSAIGVEHETADDPAPDTAPTAAEADSAANAPAPAAEPDRAATPVKSKPSKARGKAKATKTSKPEPAAGGEATRKPTPRAGTKQALMIDLLKRPEGATIEQIAEATGWQNHTIRGAISGALKKKLGLTVEATRTREVGPNRTGAKGSATIYRIVA
jgi:DNA-binding MarR family transcriptional regulator